MSLNEILLNIIFYALALTGLFSSFMVATSTNMVRTAFSLLGVLFSFAGLYGLLRADFLFAAQILVYVGGILVLIIFAIMLTHKIANVNLSNESTSSSTVIAVVCILFAVLVFIALTLPEYIKINQRNKPLTEMIGNNLLSDSLLPFEILSVLLLACLIGAVYLARKEVKE
ncbi:MAG: NADH-quinone oxidoreductase subunit J [Planctomycetes bacterium]|nr:NADH-quinone oxidoreductase subunit J [Planctomycetota bacterium]